MSEGYLPDLFLEEVSPPFRETPDAWLKMTDAGPVLEGDGGFDDVPLADGQILHFSEGVNHGTRTMTLLAEGYVMSSPAPEACNQFWIDEDWCEDLMNGSLDDLSWELREADGEIGEPYKVGCMEWRDHKLRFDHASMSFKPVEQMS